MRDPKDSLLYMKEYIQNISGVYEPSNPNIQNHIASTSNPHGTTASQVGAYTTTQVDTLLTGYSLTSHNHNGVYEPVISKSTGYWYWNGSTLIFKNETYSLSSHNHTGTYEPANANIQTHIASTSNPHSTTAAQVGAYTTSQVDTLLTGYSLTSHNHSGVYEPVITKSTGYWYWNGTSLIFKNETYSLSTHNHTGTYEPANANIQTHIASTSNPHSTTASQVGALDLTGGTLTGDLQISKVIPVLKLTDTAATTTFNKTYVVNDTGNFRLQTYTNADVFVGNDYLIDKNASGATQHRFRTANANKFIINSTEVSAGADNASSCGTAALRWSTVYAATGTINTSDANFKTDIKSIEETERLVAIKIKTLFKKFKYKDSVEAKGLLNARIHIGLIAQEVRDAFFEYGLNPTYYGMFCEDEWYEREEEEDVDGVISTHLKIYNEPVEGGVYKSRLALRYEELLCFIIASI